MQTGIVKFFNIEKRYGFIKADDDGKDYFVHQNNIKDGKTITQGDSVKFELIDGKKGEMCDKVEVV